MNTTRIVALVLIVLGVVGIVVGSFSFTTETHEAEIGPMHLEVSEEKTVNIPLWAGIGAIALGGGMLFAGAKTKSA